MTIARFRASAQNANDPPLELIGVGGLAGVHHVDNEPPDHDADPCRTPPVGLGANLGAAADEKEIKEPAEDAVEESQEHDLASSRARSLAPSAADRPFRTPHRLAVPFGMTGADIVTGALAMAIMVGCGLVEGWRPHHGLAAALAAFALLVLLRYAVTWVGMFVGLAARDEQAVDQWVPIVFPVTMISNAFVPTAGMPAWLRVVAEWNPGQRRRRRQPPAVRQPGRGAGEHRVAARARRDRDPAQVTSPACRLRFAVGLAGRRTADRSVPVEPTVGTRQPRRRLRTNVPSARPARTDDRGDVTSIASPARDRAGSGKHWTLSGRPWCLTRTGSTVC
jgi:hypothetical protein